MASYSQAYRKSTRGKAARDRHDKSPKRQASLRRYRQSPAGKAARKRFMESPKGIARAREYAKTRPKRVRNPTMGKPKYLTYAEAAADIGVHKGTIQNVSATGAFSVVRVNQRVVRIAVREWERYKAERTTNPPRRGRPRKPF